MTATAGRAHGPTTARTSLRSPARRRSRVLAAAALLVLAAWSPAASAADGESKSAHIAARGDVDDATLRRYVDLAESAYLQWKAYFRGEPKKADLPLRLDVRADRDKFLAALRIAGVGPNAVASAGGYYDPGTKTSYLYLQPHDSSSRLLVLHELTHQFQAKAALDNDLTKSPLWHKEGLAEHFGHHRRLADGVAMGALDVVTIDDRPMQCAERVRSGQFDPWAVGTGALASPDYTDALALVETLLRTKDKVLGDAFRRFEGDLAKGGDPGRRFEREFTGKKERLAAAAKEVWGDFRRTWKVVFIAWDEEPGAIVAHGRPWAYLQGGRDLPREKTAIEATIELAGRDAVGGGVAIGAKVSAEPNAGQVSLIGAEVRSDGRVLLRRRTRDTWFELANVARPAGIASAPTRLRLEASGFTITLDVDGTRVASVNAAAGGFAPSDTEGPPALYAEGGPVRFSSVKLGE